MPYIPVVYLLEMGNSFPIFITNDDEIILQHDNKKDAFLYGELHMIKYLYRDYVCVCISDCTKDGDCDDYCDCFCRLKSYPKPQKITDENRKLLSSWAKEFHSTFSNCNERYHYQTRNNNIYEIKIVSIT